MWTLPTENVPPRSFREVGRTLAFTLALLLATNAVAAFGIAERAPNLGYAIIEEKFRLADTADAPVDWLFLGDSTCNQGLSPRAFEELTGQTALNLCMTGDMTVLGDAWVLERAMSAGVGPRRGILVSHAYDVWRRDSSVLRVVAPIVPGSWGWRRARPVYPAPLSELAEASVGRHVPLVTRPKSVWNLLVGLVRPRPERSFDPLGFMQGVEASPDRVAQDVAEHVGRPEPASEYRLSDLARMALVTMDEQADVPILLAGSPMAADLWEEPEVRERVSSVAASIRQLAENRDGLVVLRIDPWTYQASQMDNADHVDEPTADLHTRAVVAAIREQGALPPQRPE